MEPCSVMGRGSLQGGGHLHPPHQYPRCLQLDGKEQKKEEKGPPPPSSRHPLPGQERLPCPGRSGRSGSTLPEHAAGAGAVGAGGWQRCRRAPMEPRWHYQFRVIMLGDSTVGKSSLLRRYTEGVFLDAVNQTVGVDFYVQFVELEPGLRVKLQFWDTAGQERFRWVWSQPWGLALEIWGMWRCGGIGSQVWGGGL